MDFKSARKIAISVGNQLIPFTEKLNIAGSVRRKKDEVKDIELICIPKTCEVPSGLLFENPVTIVDPAFVDALQSLGKIIKGQPDGRYMQILLHQDIMLDLFLPDPVDYYRQFAIRTGSAKYSAIVLASAWVQNGWCGSDKGLRLVTDCRSRITGGKKVWSCVNPDPQLPPVWASEEEFFTWLNLEWVLPEQRNS